MSPRPQIDHIRKPQLLAAAAEVIAERGFEATRIADVAERAGTSPPAVLYWFDSRDALLAEALTFAERAFHDDLAARSSRSRTRATGLRADRPLGRRRRLGALDRAVDARASRPQVRESRQRLDDHWRAQIATIIADGQASGDFAGPDPERAALELAALIDGLAVQVALGDRLVSPELMRSTCVEVAERVLAVELRPGSPQEPGDLSRRELLQAGAGWRWPATASPAARSSARSTARPRGGSSSPRSTATCCSTTGRSTWTRP